MVVKKLRRTIDRKWPEAALYASIFPNITTWCEVAVSKLSMIPNKTLISFQLDEILHYLQKEDILRGLVNMNRDMDHVLQMYNEQVELGSPGLFADRDRLKEPEDVIGKKIGSVMCPKCKLTDTLLTPRQARSADEPTSEYYQCLKCSHRWRVN